MMRKCLLALALGAALVNVHAAERPASGPWPSLNYRLVSVSIEDAKEHNPLQLFSRAGGRGYVVAESGAYEIVVRNRTDDELLVVPSVDGVNVLTGKTAAADQGGYIVPPRGSVRIDGWRKSLTEVARFYFTSLPDSYAARTGRPDNVGVIGLAVFEKAPPQWTDRSARLEKAEPGSAPAAPMANEGMRARVESMASTNKADSAAPSGAPVTPRLGTGHGERQVSEVTYRSFVRRTPYANEVVVLEYDTVLNLRARGVLPRLPVAPAEPNPFPAQGFVPDPPAR